MDFRPTQTQRIWFQTWSENRKQRILPEGVLYRRMGYTTALVAWCGHHMLSTLEEGRDCGLKIMGATLFNEIKFVERVFTFLQNLVARDKLADLSVIKKNENGFCFRRTTGYAGTASLIVNGYHPGQDKIWTHLLVDKDYQRRMDYKQRLLRANRQNSSLQFVGSHDLAADLGTEGPVLAAPLPSARAQLVCLCLHLPTDLGQLIWKFAQHECAWCVDEAVGERAKKRPKLCAE